LVLSVGGNGRSYVLILEAGPSGDPSQSKLYFARISTKVGFCRVRTILPLVALWFNHYDQHTIILLLLMTDQVVAFMLPICITMTG
jgi:hypothetical protein